MVNSYVKNGLQIFVRMKVACNRAVFKGCLQVFHMQPWLVAH